MKLSFSINRALAMARKEAIHIKRDPSSLALAFLLPLILFMLFGYALSFDVDRVPFVVWDRDQTPQSREVIEAFNGSTYFSYVGAVNTESVMDAALNRGDALIGLVLPRGFAARYLEGKPASIQLLADGSDSVTSQLAVGYAKGVVSGMSATLALAARSHVDARIRILYNPELKSRDFTVSGLLALIMIIVGAVLTCLTVAKEWEQGTMEQIIATRVSPGEILLGKFLPYFVIGILDLGLGIALAAVVFKVPLNGSLVLLMLLSALFLAVALGQGLLISVMARNQLLANQLALVTSFLPAFLLSGFFAPIDNMPAAVRAVTYLVPARYAMEICRGIMLKGVGIRVLWPEAVALAFFAFILFFLARRKFVRRII